MGYDLCMQADGEEERGSETGEMDAGLQMDTGAVGLDVAAKEVLEGLEVISLTGEFLFFAGLLQVCALLSFCCCCWRHFALRFLNQTCKVMSM